jgi:protein-tyrosine-phosphatase
MPHPEAGSEPGGGAGGRFRILVVCVGNLCRSPLAERLIRARLDAALGSAADRFTVGSAGTEAAVGEPMAPRAAEVARDLGADPDGCTARQLTAELVADADLVLAAGREQRAEVVRLHPPAHRYAFTLLEFARLVAAPNPAAGHPGAPSSGDPQPGDPQPAGPAPGGPAPAGPAPADPSAGGPRPGDAQPGGVPPDDPVERAHALVAAARARRGATRAGQPADDDVPDPFGDVEQLHRTVGTAIRDALAGPLAAICGDAEPPPPPAPPAPRRPAGPRVRRRGRPALLAVLAGLVLVGAAVGWLLLRGLQARAELAAARDDLRAVRSALLAGEPERARTALADARRRAARARRLTDDPVWRLSAGVPYLGGPPAAVRTVTAVVDDLTSRALPALVDAGAALAPDRLRPRGDRVAVAAFGQARPAIQTAAAAVAAARARLAEVGGWLPGPLAAAVEDTGAELAHAAATLDGVGRAARLAPALLGAGGPRRYLLVFQNNAEARGTGGLPGLYAVLAVAAGRIRVERLGSNTDLRGADRLPVDLGPAYTAQWGQDPALWPNSNLDPSFPAAARIWLALWQRQTGQRLDGALATDPVAVGYLLAVTGPVRLPSGEALTAANVVPLTMSQVYARFAAGEPQNAFLRAIAGSTVTALLGSRARPRALLAGLARAGRERRLVVYSAHPAEERDLVAAGLGGTLPEAPGPYAFVVVNNAAGNKMDYYLHRSVDYAGGRCLAGQRDSRITIRFGNSLPPAARLPEYVTQRTDRGAGTLRQSAAPGAVVALVSVYGPRQAGVVASTLDGRPLPVSALLVAGRPVWAFPLVVPPGRSRTVVLDIREPASAAAPVVPVQPLVQPQAVTTSLRPCG